MTNSKLKENLTWVGSLDPTLRSFDIIMTTQFGTSYNAYLLQGSQKTALIETVKSCFFNDFAEKVEAQTPISELDYLIVNHTEPDHVGSVAKLLEKNPDLTIVGSATAVNFLKEIVNRPFQSLVVKEGDCLSLGDKTLRFLSVPQLHWPDSMYTYWEESKVLFTCDSFGSHYCHSDLLRSSISNSQDYLDATKYYFDMILSPFKTFMLQALTKVDKLEVDMICPGHGPVLDCQIKELKNLYRLWCQPLSLPQKPLVVLPYVSAYGYTAQIAKAIAQGIEETGETTAALYDMEHCSAEEVLAQINLSAGLLLGSPTILKEALPPIWQLLNTLNPVLHGGKCASAFGSYGWSGEGVPHLLERLNQLNMKTTEGFRVRFCPSEDDLNNAHQFGKNFVTLMLTQPTNQN